MCALRKSKTSAKETTLPGKTTTNHERPAKIPTMIDRYPVESFFAKGGISQLYLAKDPKTFVPLVIKTLDPQFINHPELTEHFLQEAHIIKSTSHPNIVRLYDYGRWQEENQNRGLYLAMELIHGVSLVPFIKEKSLSVHRSLEIALHVCSALAHLHEHGVIHRDIKPENILISEEGETKVIDFGVAQLCNRKTIPLQGKIGTLSYMSPEQKEDPSSVTFASDIYSLGIVLFELLTGKMSHGFVEISLLPLFLQPLLSKMVAPDPQKRYRTAFQVIQDISSILSDNLHFLEKERGWQGLQVAFSKKARFFLPLSRPRWTGVEFDFSILGDEKLGIAMQLLTFTPYTYGILFLKTCDQNPFSSLELSYILSLFDTHTKMFVQHNLSSKKPTPFHTADFLLPIQEMTREKEIEIRMSLLVVDIHADMLAWTSCNLGALCIHNPDSKQVSSLTSVNPNLGSDEQAFDIVHEPFVQGASLLLTTFDNKDLQDSFQTSLSLGVSAHKDLLLDVLQKKSTPLSQTEILLIMDRIS